jgi:hypothetical protein
VKISPPPDRPDPNINTVPSHDSDARVSLTTLLMPGPRFDATPHGASTEDLRAVQTSWPPSVPYRLESNTISSPSCRTFGRASLMPASDVLTPPGASWAGPVRFLLPRASRQSRDRMLVGTVAFRDAVTIEE